jgi:2-polyprenyl-3-methyl-5-hydroxy-6-metoxy-1,4-benzoquinol methylase
MIHILEHVADPDGFLYLAKECLMPKGKLYVEVPDAVEFDYLPETHDEFNSCHVHFFDAPTLYKLVEAAGFRVEDIHRVRYKKRDLSRILVLAKC